MLHDMPMANQTQAVYGGWMLPLKPNRGAKATTPACAAVLIGGSRQDRMLSPSDQPPEFPHLALRVIAGEAIDAIVGSLPAVVLLRNLRIYAEYV
jgi:hypothetical protein